ncbi:response regulator transcription factor [Kribbella sp. NBC_01510]|uniref:response regulator transcription factor n=1 Tax=Kribbella sp. NBC_01510 TaxID=2903581 RepID=UPI003865914F
MGTPTPTRAAESASVADRELARSLFVSEATVKSHLSHIYTKLEVDTRAAAVARAIEQRIIRPPG